jgi:hypothetical protein
LCTMRKRSKRRHDSDSKGDTFHVGLLFVYGHAVDLQVDIDCNFLPPRKVGVWTLWLRSAC